MKVAWLFWLRLALALTYLTLSTVCLAEKNGWGAWGFIGGAWLTTQLEDDPTKVWDGVQFWQRRFSRRRRY